MPAMRRDSSAAESIGVLPSPGTNFCPLPLSMPRAT